MALWCKDVGNTFPRPILQNIDLFICDSFWLDIQFHCALFTSPNNYGVLYRGKRFRSKLKQGFPFKYLEIYNISLYASLSVSLSTWPCMLVALHWRLYDRRPRYWNPSVRLYLSQHTTSSLDVAFYFWLSICCLLLVALSSLESTGHGRVSAVKVSFPIPSWSVPNYCSHLPSCQSGLFFLVFRCPPVDM